MADLTTIFLLMGGCGILIMAAFALAGYQTVELGKIKKVTYISTGSWGEVMVWLSRYDLMESPEEELAKFTKLSPREIKIEIERKGIIGFVGGIARTNIEVAKATVPDVALILAPIEAKYQR